jgi:hypothetical protein
MGCWLYQMNAKLYSHERYRTEVWEGNLVTNWGIGESKRKPKEVPLGDTIILFFTKTGAVDPGIYGWGVITLFDKEVIDFRPVAPSDYLKMNPLWDDETSNIIDQIRCGMPEGTMWKVDDGTLKLLRQKIATHVYGVSS